MHRLTQFDTFPIPVNQIFFDDEFNCRGPISPESVEELAESIRKDGQAVPVMVQPKNDCKIPVECNYRLICGHRRFYAVAKILGKREIPCTICRGLSEQAARKINLVENLERENLNALQEATALGRLYPNWTANSIAKDLNRPYHWVQDRLSILRMPAEIQMKVASGLLTPYQIRLIAAQPHEQWAKIVEDIENGVWSDSAENKNKKRISKREIAELEFQMLDKGLLDTLGPRVASRCAGDISEEEIRYDINREVARQAAHKANRARISSLEDFIRKSGLAKDAVACGLFPHPSGLVA